MSGPPPDIIVVGNGVIGSSLAFELSRRGHRVTLVGERLRPYSASMAAGAMLGCFGEVTTGLLASESGRAKLAADYRARRLWPQWDEDLAEVTSDDHSLYVARGTFLLLNTMGTATVDSGNFKAIEMALREYEEPYETVNPEEIDWFAPDDLARSLRGLFIPAEHGVDADRLLSKLTSAVERAGGRIADAAATGIRFARNRVIGVQLADGQYLYAGQVVIAAGARSLSLLEEIDDIRRHIPPMMSGYGVSALLDTVDGRLPAAVLRTPNRAFACGIHCIPRGGGVLYVGGTNVLSETPRKYATIRDLRFLLECAVEQLHSDLPQAGVRSVQVGNRPVSADGFPLIGRAGIDGLWLATGTYRDGLHQSPLIAKYLSNLIEGGEGTAAEISELARFSPVRAPLAGASREQVIEATVEQMMASGYETHWRVTPEWPTRIQGHLRRHYAEVVEMLHPTFTPPPEFVAKMTDSIRADIAAYYGSWS
jgi:glycine oxidase